MKKQIKYKCEFCKKEYDTEGEANKCEKEHIVIDPLIPLSKIFELVDNYFEPSFRFPDFKTNEEISFREFVYKKIKESEKFI